MKEARSSAPNPMRIKRSPVRRVTELAFAGALSVTGIACSDGASTKPTQVENSASPIDQWHKKTPLERIHDIENASFQLEGLSYGRELISAIADLYCGSIPCGMNPEQLKQQTYFVNAETTLAEIEKIEGPIPPEKRAEESLTRVEIVNESNQVFINVDALDTMVAYFSSMNPDVVLDLQSRNINIKNYVLRNILIHSFSHVAANHTEVDLGENGHSAMVGGIGVDRINRIVRFDYRGLKPDGTEAVLDGFNEATAEFIAQIVENQIDEYIPLIPSYQEGALLIRIINDSVGITTDEFIQYATGQKPLEEYINRIGKKVMETVGEDNIVNRGSFLLFLIALHGDGFATLGEVVSVYNHDLGILPQD